MSHEWVRAESAAFLDSFAPVAEGRSVIWDFDGVVADTEPLHEASFRVLGAQRGWEPDRDYFRTVVGQTEAWVWERMFSDGFPVRGERTEDMRELMSARRGVFLEQVGTSLSPSWLSGLLMPALSRSAVEQVIISNGDVTVIEELLQRWSLDEYVTVIRRTEGEDKRGLLEARLSEDCVLIEDDARWLAMGAAASAATVAVRHGHNRDPERTVGDFVVRL